MIRTLIRYLNTLRKEAKKYECIDVNGVANGSVKDWWVIRLVLAVISVSIVIYLDQGFKDDFVSYFSSVLSILVGLFITALVFSFDKFYTPKDLTTKVYKISLDEVDKDEVGLVEKDYKLSMGDVTELNAEQKLWNKQSSTYSMQFSYLTGYNIVLSICLILLLALNTLFDAFHCMKISDYYFVLSGLTFEDVVLFCKLCIVACQRFLVLYFIGIVMYKTIFIVSSMVQYNVVKMRQ